MLTSQKPGGARNGPDTSRHEPRGYPGRTWSVKTAAAGPRPLLAGTDAVDEDGVRAGRLQRS